MSILEYIHGILYDLPAITELVPMLQPSQAGDLASESAQFDLSNLKTLEIHSQKMMTELLMMNKEISRIRVSLQK